MFYKKILLKEIDNRFNDDDASLCNRSVYNKGGISKKMREIRDWASPVADFIFDILDK